MYIIIIFTYLILFVLFQLLLFVNNKLTYLLIYLTHTMLQIIRHCVSLNKQTITAFHIVFSWRNPIQETCYLSSKA